MPVLRPSSLADYADCPRRAAAKLYKQEINNAGYLLRETPRGVAASIGTAVHAGIAYGLDKKAKQETLKQEDAIEAAVEELNSQTKDGVFFDALSSNMSSSQKQVMRMTSYYLHQTLPKINPVKIEYKMTYSINENFVLSGTTDLIGAAPAAIRDHKTGAKIKAFYAQLGAYSFLARKEGYKAEYLMIDFIQRVSLQKEQPDVVNIQYNVDVSEMAARQIIIRMIKDYEDFMGMVKQSQAAEHAFIANPASMLCSDKYCPAWGTKFCREHFKSKEETYE